MFTRVRTFALVVGALVLLCAPAIAISRAAVLNTDYRLHPTAEDLAPFSIVIASPNQLGVDTRSSGAQRYVYVKGARWPTTDLDDSWYLHDARGQKVRDTVNNNYYMDPGNREWQAFLDDRCTSLRAAEAAAGCFIDGIGPSSLARASSTIIDPRTGQPITQAGWLVAVHELLARVSSPFIANSAGNGYSFYEIGSKALLLGTNMIATEGWLDRTMPEGVWNLSEQMLSDGPLLVIAEPPRPRDRAYVIGSFLLGTDGDDFLSIGKGAATLVDHRKLDLRLGTPTSEAHRRRDLPMVWQRGYQDATVLVNPSEERRRVRLANEWYRPGGRQVRSVTLLPHSAVMLLRDAP